LIEVTVVSQNTTWSVDWPELCHVTFSKNRLSRILSPAHISVKVTKFGLKN